MLIMKFGGFRCQVLLSKTNTINYVCLLVNLVWGLVHSKLEAQWSLHIQYNGPRERKHNIYYFEFGAGKAGQKYWHRERPGKKLQQKILVARVVVA